MKKNNVAVLVNSCDAYCDIWQYFFYFVDTYWQDCPYRFYLNTETLSYDWISPIGDRLIVLNSGKNVPWSKRLLFALDRIEEEYVIHILDDSFLLEDVKQNVIDSCVVNLKNNNNIGCYHFEEKIANPYHIETDDLGFRIMDNRENYLASAYVTLWRKSFFKKLLRNKENPWQFELYATERCRHYKEKIFVLGENQPSVIHYYIKGKGGFGISGGKWAPNTVNLFKKHGLECDFSKRGFYDVEKQIEEEIKLRNPKLSFIDKLLLPVTDNKLFKEKMDPRVRMFRARMDVRGRLVDLFD